MQTKGYGSAPPPQPGDHPLWTSSVLPSAVAAQRRIFCNRALNMKHIKAVGFDMDYTLAQYRPETFEALAHRETVDKLVRCFGYPEALRTFTFCWDYMMKGLIIDKARGNILKVDRHKYVKLAYHGFAPLSADQRKSQYNASYQSLNFDDDGYALVDTLFSLAEAYLYMQLVELKDSAQGGGLAHKTYSQLYKDLRTAVDMCHRDGSLKKAVAANPEQYIHHDPLLIKVLQSLAASGRRLFIATNSLWDYTNVVMNYLLLGKTGSAKTTDWLQYFDVVMVGCGKPGFFNDRGQLFSVDTKSGLLSNTDNGAPILPVDEADMAQPEVVPPGVSGLTPSLAGGGVEKNAGGRPNVFQGGSYRDLHRMLGVTSGQGTQRGPRRGVWWGRALCGWRCDRHPHRHSTQAQRPAPPHRRGLQPPRLHARRRLRAPAKVQRRRCGPCSACCCWHGRVGAPSCNPCAQPAPYARLHVRARCHVSARWWWGHDDDPHGSGRSTRWHGWRADGRVGAAACPPAGRVLQSVRRPVHLATLAPDESRHDAHGQRAAAGPAGHAAAAVGADGGGCVQHRTRHACVCGQACSPAAEADAAPASSCAAAAAGHAAATPASTATHSGVPSTF